MGCFATEENTEDDNPPIGINYSRRRFKMKSVTRYFRNAVAASMQGTVNYKKERFFVVTEGELLSGKLSEENNFNIWKKEYDAESDNDEEKLKIKNVIIALKTLATEFRDGGKMEDNIEEMTSFFFLPLCVTRTGKLCMPVEGKIPWIPREYLRPMEDPLLAVGDGEKYDEFLEHTTNERYQLDSWQDYLAYAIKLYEFVAEIPFKSNYCAVSLIFNITTASYSDAVVNVGYKEFNLILASSVRNCQFTFAATVFRSTSHADNSLRRFEILSILLFKHCLVMTLSSISAISSQLPCFGV